MDPTDIFRLCYMAPMENEEHAADIAKMLTLGSWKSKINHILSLGTPENGECDGYDPSGKRIHNLLCCNMSRIKELEHEIRQQRCKVVVHDWQRRIMEDVYETELDAIELSPSHFRGLLLAAQAKK